MTGKRWMVGDGPAPGYEAGEAVTTTMTTMELEYVEDVIDFVLWDTPTSLFPTHERVWQLAGELAARSDVANSIVQAALVECWKFLGFESTTSH